MRRAFAFASLDQYVSMIVGLALIAGISRLLAPDEVGIAAIGTGIATVAFTLREFVSAELLIQRPVVEPSDIRTAFTLMTAANLCIAAGILVAAPWISAVYHAPGLRLFLAIMCLTGLMDSLTIPVQAMLRREMAFGPLAAINTGSLAASAAVSLGLAATGHGFMSLAWGQAAGAFVRTALSVQLGPSVAHLRPSLASWRAATRFGGYFAGMTLITRATEAMPQLLLGFFMPLTAVGFYNRASLVAGLPGRFLLTPIYSLALPALSAQTRDGGDLKGAYLRGLSFLSVVYCPAMAMLAILAGPMVTIVLGAGWAPVVPVVRILALGGITFFPAVLTTPLLIAAGDIRQAFFNCLVARGAGAIVLVAASFYGLVALAWGQLVALQFVSVMAVLAAKWSLKFSLAELLWALLPSAVVSVCALAGPLAMLASGEGRLGSIETLGGLLLAPAGWLIGLVVVRHPFRHELNLVFGKFRSGFAVTN